VIDSASFQLDRTGSPEVLTAVSFSMGNGDPSSIATMELYGAVILLIAYLYFCLLP
jgi:hypothetical protein